MKEGGPTLVKKGAGNCKIEPALCFNIPAQENVYSFESESQVPGDPEENQWHQSGDSGC